MSDLYEDDILLWSERQAELLRRRAANELDWQNLAEEIEDVGKSQLCSVASHLVQVLLHDLKAEAWPQSLEVPHWRAEAGGQRDEARAAYAPSMKERPELDPTTLYCRALRRMPETKRGGTNAGAAGLPGHAGGTAGGAGGLTIICVADALAAWD